MLTATCAVVKFGKLKCQLEGEQIMCKKKITLWYINSGILYNTYTNEL